MNEMLPVREFAERLEAKLPYNPRVLPAFRDVLAGLCDILPAFDDQHPARAGQSDRFSRLGAFEVTDVPAADGLTLRGRASISPPLRPWVILLHGLYRSARSPHVYEQARVLLREGYSVLALDTREHGLSMPVTPLTCTLGWREAFDVIEAARWLRTTRDARTVSVCGVSLGGRYGLRAAIESSRSGEKVIDALFASVPAVSVEDVLAGVDETFPMRFVAGIKRSLIRERFQRMARLRGMDPNPGWIRDRSLSTREVAHRYFDSIVLPGIGRPGHEEIVRRSDPIEGLGEITVPTLVFATRDDPLIRFRQHERWFIPATAGNPNIGRIYKSRGGHTGIIVVERRFFHSMAVNFLDRYGR